MLEDTLAFKEALFSSTVPEVVKEAVSANLSVLKSPTVLRLTDGSLYGFEGCIEDVGCCEGSCTHVWNYAYAVPFLFPRLERSMRDLDFKYNQRDDGKMAFRLMLPIGRERMDCVCADGQFGGVIKAYRDWKISGDTEWLKSVWPAIKRSISYAWSDSNEDRWDPGKTGVLTGRQHHTLDMELFGPNSWLNGFYLAALKAGAEMADYLGEGETSEEFESIFRKGKKWVDEYLFNGEYYVQQVDLTDKSLLEQFDEDTCNTFWNKELGEIKYQIAGGCAIDQVLAQWHANLCGIGEVFDREQTRSALGALYRHNFKASMRGEANTWRLY
ncbi:GH116 family glycosyl hydrolase [Cohnella soli]|uniref:GH116 family glycosyl hydrolase n=1 Tax=Cohnella soli TaxID=425005 RepID=A0ABW0HL03_9BACL